MTLFGFPWLVASSLQSCCPSSEDSLLICHFNSACVYLWVAFPFVIKEPVKLDEVPTLFQYVCLVAQSRLTLCDPVDYSPPGFIVHGDSPDKNTGVGCHAFLQRIFPTQGSTGLPHCRQILYHLNHQGGHQDTSICPLLNLLIYLNHIYKDSVCK